MKASWALNSGAGKKRKDGVSDPNEAKRRTITTFEPLPLDEEDLAKHYEELLRKFVELSGEGDTPRLPNSIWRDFAIDTMREHGLSNALGLCRVNKQLETAICLSADFWLEAIRLYYGFSIIADENGSDWALVNERISQVLVGVSTGKDPDGGDNGHYRGRQTRKLFRRLTASIKDPVAIVAGGQITMRGERGVWITGEQFTSVVGGRPIAFGTYRFRTYLEVAAAEAGLGVYDPVIRLRVPLVQGSHVDFAEASERLFVRSIRGPSDTRIFDLNRARSLGEIYSLGDDGGPDGNSPNSLEALRFSNSDIETIYVRYMTDRFIYAVVKTLDGGLSLTMLKEPGKVDRLDTKSWAVVRFDMTKQLDPAIVEDFEFAPDFNHDPEIVRVDESELEDGSHGTVVHLETPDGTVMGQPAISLTSRAFVESADRSAVIMSSSAYSIGGSDAPYIPLKLKGDKDRRVNYVLAKNGERRLVKSAATMNAMHVSLPKEGRVIVVAHDGSSAGMIYDRVEYEKKYNSYQLVSAKPVFFKFSPIFALSNIVIGYKRRSFVEFVSFVQLSLDSSPGVEETWLRP